MNTTRSEEPLALSRRYTAKDFTALRAFVQRIPPATIARTYFDSDEDAFAATPASMERYLRDMHDTLVDLAIEHGSPVLADFLKTSIKKHGSARLAAESLRMVEAATKIALASPAPDHGVGMWFRPMVAQRLKGCGIRTLRDLVQYLNRHGGTWWRSVPRIGAGRARVIVRWVRSHEPTIGLRIDEDVDMSAPLVRPLDELVTVDRSGRSLAPLEHMQLTTALSGASGPNRSSAFCFVSARHDLDAVRAYLNQFRDQPKTLRAYTKELERFVLWCVCFRGKAMGAALVEDCEAYKDFVKHPAPSFVGPKTLRGTQRWRPFATDSLSAESQRYAIRTIRGAFSWLVDVRYLAGNPWMAVKDPVVTKREYKLKIDRALPDELWARVRSFVATQSSSPDASRWRIVRALMLLMGSSGLRREEAANAQRIAIRPSQLVLDGSVWELTVVGKRLKERTVPVSLETIEALIQHWNDRGEDFVSAVQGPLVAPLIVPRTPRATRRHQDVRNAYSTNAINDLIGWGIEHILADMDGLTEANRKALYSTSPHSFRHTFASRAASEMSLDVLRDWLGHESLDTTSIYVQAEKRRMFEAAELLYAKKKRAPR